ncbi:MAG: hypothetical protein Q8P84_04690 [Deltaproteobacteria bacterium]|nr:hypothetical protein [Deltaproteobacteria bacterium]MDZ4224364.1 hypothetical protein [bacterium]
MFANAIAAGADNLYPNLEAFIDNYPHIEGIDTREQFQTNDLPPLLESVPESKKKRW